jgi:hypothetical protein
MITEARMATGVKYKSLVRSSNDMITVTAITIFDTAVSQPALKLTAVRENEPALSCQKSGTIVVLLFEGTILKDESNDKQQ